jgi:hypothetical protein
MQTDEQTQLKAETELSLDDLLRKSESRSSRSRPDTAHATSASLALRSREPLDRTVIWISWWTFSPSTRLGFLPA